MHGLDLVIAFIAGLVSFLSPCVLPIIPGFLAYLSGTSIGQAGTRRSEIFANSVFFVIGFSIVFAVLGVLLNTILVHVGYGIQTWLSRIGGIFIIFFGIYLTGLVRIPFLEREHKPRVSLRLSSRHLTSMIFGAAFAAGWTPCVGPALGSILTLAATAPGSAFGLLLVYSLGLGVPFLIVGLFTAQAAAFINRYAGVLKYVNIAFGVILIGVGILVFTQSINYLANFSLLNSLLLH